MSEHIPVLSEVTEWAHYHGTREAVRTMMLFVLSCACACDARPGPVRVTPSEPAEAESISVTAVDEASLASAETTLVLDRSAYGVKLIAVGSGWSLVTAEGVYQQQGETPAVHHSSSINSPFALMGQQVVHWADGQLLATPLSGASPSTLAAVEQMPREVFASNEHFSWLERTKLGDRILVPNKHPEKQGAEKQGARVVYSSEHDIVSGAMIQDWVFFVESLPNEQWRLGAASIRKVNTLPQKGGAATLGPARIGRPPAFLLAENELYFYDGPTRSVRRVTPDLQEETTVATGVICSPMAVEDRVYCAHVGGVFSLSAQVEEGSPSQSRVLDSHPQGPITAVAAGRHQVVWVEDLAGKQLRVRTIRLP